MIFTEIELNSTIIINTMVLLTMGINGDRKIKISIPIVWSP